jgi:hypothetical protein
MGGIVYTFRFLTDLFVQSNFNDTRSALLQSNPILPIRIHAHLVSAEMGSITQAKEHQTGLASS